MYQNVQQSAVFDKFQRSLILIQSRNEPQASLHADLPIPLTLGSVGKQWRAAM